MVSTALTLAGTGVTLGVVHVLTGPDHLSAIATLSATVGNSNGAAFWLGIRWGVGHSTGLLAVGIVFIVLSLSSDSDVIAVPDKISHFFESLVGIFMLLLGAYGVRRAWNKHPNVVVSHESISDPASSVLFADPTSPIPSNRPPPPSTTDQQLSEVERITSYQQTPGGQHITFADGGNNSVEQFEDESSRGGEDNQHRGRCCSWMNDVTRRLSAQTLALGAGIVHGLAGPGGVLGVVPAVQLHSFKWATLYLSFFCLSSTLTMGLFATLYGSCSARMAASAASSASTEDDNEDDDENMLAVVQYPTPPTKRSFREFWIELFSASLSILVGITWLVLLSIGKLDDVFP